MHEGYGPDQASARDDPAAGTVLAVLGAFGVAELDGFVAGVVALDAALHQGLTTTDEARAWIRRLRRRPGSGVIRRVVAVADGLSESPLETRCRLVLTALGYEVLLQVRLVTVDGVFVARVDLLIPALGVVVEVDGRVKYRLADGTGSVEAVVSERRRESAVTDLGYAVVRVDHAGLGHPEQLRKRITDAARRVDPAVIIGRSQTT